MKLSAIFGKKHVKRDVKGRKMTQKGAIHQKNKAKQPNRSKMTNHERMAIREMARYARAERIKQEDDEDAKFRKVITK